MERAIEVVEAFLKENDWTYSTQSLKEGIFRFELPFTVRNVRLRLRIMLEAEAKVCQIDAVLPITPDPQYVYPLCSLLAKENYNKRYGSFKFDERDGELTYEYSFSIARGLETEDLDKFFHAVVGSALAGYDEIRRYCVGRFKGDEAKVIVEKANLLINDLCE